MRLEEIEYGYFNKPSIPEDAILQDPVIIGKFDGLDIVKFSFNDTNVGYCILGNNNQYISYMLVNLNSITEIYTATDARRSGYMSIILLWYLRNKGNLQFDSNTIVTDASRQLVYRLANAKKIQVYDQNRLLTLEELGSILKDTNNTGQPLILSKHLIPESINSWEIREVNSINTELSELAINKTNYI